MAISVDNPSFSYPVYLKPLLREFSSEFGNGSGAKKTRVMALPNAGKSFTTCAIILTQHWLRCRDRFDTSISCSAC